MFEYLAQSEAETFALATCLSKILAGKGLVLLQGQLGAGKTTFTRGLLRAMGHEGAVKSPTFTLVEPYEINGKSVFHFDLYRLADPEELEYLGVDDYLSANNLCLIEWADKGGSLLPPWDINVAIGVEGLSRRFVITANSQWGAEICGLLAARMSAGMDQPIANDQRKKPTL